MTITVTVKSTDKQSAEIYAFDEAQEDATSAEIRFLAILERGESADFHATSTRDIFVREINPNKVAVIDPRVRTIPQNDQSAEDLHATVDSASDQRTANNVMRHEYRVLSDDEKAKMKAIKDAGADFLALVESCGGSRELALAKTKIEEAVMWAVKHITA